MPNLRGGTTGDVSVEIGEAEPVVMRSGSSVSIKAQANDCAQGGVFQTKPERRDGQVTRIVDTLAQLAVQR